MGVKDTLKLEHMESFIKMPKTMMHVKEFGSMEVYYLAVIKSMAGNFTKTATLTIAQLMTVTGVNARKSERKQRVKECVLKLQDLGYIEVYDCLKTKKVMQDMKPSATYHIMPTGKDEEYGFSKIFNEDLNVITTMNSNHRPKIFATYFNLVGNMFYDNNSNRNVPLGFPEIWTIMGHTGCKEETVNKYIDELQNEKLIFRVTVRMNKTLQKHYYTRHIHREHALGWALENASYYYRVDKDKLSVDLSVK